MTESPRPGEFRRFHELLTEHAPDGYTPWYFRVAEGSKAPATRYGSWKVDEARLSAEEAIEWMEDGGNVGVAGTDSDELVNVDIDDEDKTTVHDLKDTLVARSRSRSGVHAWYFESPTSNVPNIPTDDDGEVRANWQYVVAPGSYVEPDDIEEVPDDQVDQAGYYTVERENPVTSLRYEELPEVFRAAYEATKQEETEPELEYDVPEDSGGGERSSALFDISAKDVVRKEGGSTDTGDRWSALFHGSDTDANMSVSDKGLIQCWRHNVAHNGLQALTVLSDYSGGCEKVGSGHKGSNAGGSCITQEEGAHIWHAWKYAKKNGYLPDDDPVPYVAIKHLCRDRELCAVTELPDTPDDGTIPAHAYDAALKTIETNDDLEPGRKPTEQINSEETGGTPANRDSIKKAEASTDGGVQASPGSPPNPQTAGTSGPLCPADVAAAAGLGEDDDVSDLNDREKAACVWDLCKQDERIHVRVRRDTGGLWAYDGGVWTREGERVLRHAAREALGSMNYGANVLAELKAQVRSDPVAEVEADTLGVEPGQIAAENGLIDLKAAADGNKDDAIRELRPHDYALTQLPAEYDPDAEYDEWQEYVEEWAEDGRADALQEYVGYCLHVGALPIHRALLLVGSGANGKGTFLHVVRSLLGSENTSSIELQTLANERDAVADFEGSLANIDDDLSARKLGAGLGMFKKLVAGDRVRGRRLYEEGFEFEAVGKHMYAANEVPDVNVPDDDEAFWRRWLLVEFPNHYPPSQRDPDLRDRLTGPEALSGVLNWAIDGWKRLLRQGYFTNEERYAQQKRERWQAWGDSVNAFISDHVERDPDAPKVTTGDAHARYVAWCRENNEEPVGQQQFTSTLKHEDVGYGTSVRIDGSVQRGYKALGFSDDVPQAEDGHAGAGGSRQERLN